MTIRHLISITELSSILDIKTPTLYAWVQQHRIPYVKVGRLVKFDMGDIEKWIATQKVTPHAVWDKP